MPTVGPPTAERLLDGLNDAQRAAVTSTGRPLRIVAGAGTGKTRVLTRRIAWRVATDDLDPRHVLALTFTRKAAGELRSRLRALGLRDAPTAGTFHAVAYAQLRSRWREREITEPRLLERKVGFVARLLPGAARDTSPLDLVGEIEWAKARVVDPDGYVAAAAAAGRRPAADPKLVAEVFARYEEARRAQRLIDFDDILRVCTRDLEVDPEFATTQRWRFRHLFVDEFQDVNPLQHRLLRAWLGDNVDLCVVGDPRQAIYAWNGADASLLEDFEDTFPTTTTISLQENYRSSPQVLAVANALLARRSEPALRATRPDGPAPVVRRFDDERSEAAGIARAARDHHGPGGRWSDQAVLVRTNAQTALIEEALRKAQIPFRVRGGAGLLDQPDVKAVLADARRRNPTLEALTTDLANAADEQRGHDDPASDERAANLDELVRLVDDYRDVDPEPSTAGWLAWLAATTRADQPDRSGDAVEITTFHGAKGLEWPVVHVAGLEQGLVPITYARTHEQLEEERRLLYVALTRSERVLRCTWASSRRFGTRDVRREPSSFLEPVEAALDALAGRAPRARPPERKARARRAPKKVLDGVELDEDGQKRFEALRTWRTEQARAAAVPAYVIFQDRTLEAIAATRPRNHDDLLALPGLGPVKVGRYGDELLRVVADAGAS